MNSIPWKSQLNRLYLDRLNIHHQCVIGRESRTSSTITSGNSIDAGMLDYKNDLSRISLIPLTSKRHWGWSRTLAATKYILDSWLQCYSGVIEGLPKETGLWYKMDGWNKLQNSPYLFNTQYRRYSPTFSSLRTFDSCRKNYFVEFENIWKKQSPVVRNLSHCGKMTKRNNAGI